MRVVRQRLRVAEAAQYYGLPPAVINTNFDKEAAAVTGAVVEVDAALIISALGQVGAVV